MGSGSQYVQYSHQNENPISNFSHYSSFLPKQKISFAKTSSSSFQMCSSQRLNMFVPKQALPCYVCALIGNALICLCLTNMLIIITLVLFTSRVRPSRHVGLEEETGLTKLLVSSLQMIHKGGTPKTFATRWGGLACHQVVFQIYFVNNLDSFPDCQNSIAKEKQGKNVWKKVPLKEANVLDCFPFVFENLPKIRYSL